MADTLPPPPPPPPLSAVLTSKADLPYLCFYTPGEYRIHIDFGSADRKLDLILAQLAGLAAQEKTDMTVTLQSIKDQADKNLAAIAAESDKDDAIIALVGAQTSVITSLKQQLADAINGGDPTALQAVLDSMTAAETSSLANAAKVVAAVNANTPPA